MLPQRASQQAFFGASALLFTASAALTIAWCGSMSSMGTMQMPGGWAMSMTWMRMPGQTWIGAAASFLAMWTVMMAAMMLPSVVPALWRYRQAAGAADESHPGPLTAILGLGYFFVWTSFGMVIFPVGAVLAIFEMQVPALARAAPVLGGLVILLAGALQFTAWKARHLAGCREAPAHDRIAPPTAGAAWRQGLRFGLHCALSCANLTAILLVIGVMDLRAMAAATALITAERLTPSGVRAVRIIGAVLIAAGLTMAARASGLR